MKKTDGGYMAKMYGIPFAVCAACIIAGFFLINSEDITIPTVLWGIGFMGPFVVLGMMPGILHKRMVKKSDEVEAGFPQTGFRYDYKFTSHNAVFYIDAGGRLGIVWRGNPSELQMADLKGLTDVRVNDGKMLGGTSLVRAMFKLDGKQYSIHTFRAHRQQYSMKSDEVLEGISKADKICEMLNQAKQSALGAKA